MVEDQLAPGVDLFIGGVLGAAAIIISLSVNHATSTDAFCTSCHSMAPKVTDPHYLQSKHISNPKGVRPSCGDCHIPKDNWFIETWVHVSSESATSSRR